MMINFSNKDYADKNEEVPHENATIPMQNYNNNSDFQADINSSGIKLLTDSAYSLSKNFPSELNIADYGCSHGKNSMACIKAALDGYLEVKEPVSILVHLNDLPSNDFDEVFNCLNDPTISYHEHALFKTIPKSKFTTKINKNSYNKRILPENSIHLGFCFCCLQWMEKPAELSQGIFPRSTMTTPEERIVLANEAHRLLTIFLQSRYQELKSKGRLVLNIFKESDLLNNFESNWQKYIKSKGFQKDQLKNVTIPSYFRPTKEINSVLNNFKDQFTIITSQSQIINSDKFTHDTIKSIFFNVLVKGIRESKIFKDNTEVVNFVDGFILSFPENHFNLTMELQLLVLEKK